VSGQVLYGTTVVGGSSNWGTIFALNTDGTGFTTLHSFTGEDDGGYPYSILVLSSNTLYGTTTAWAGAVGGTAFKINTDGTEFNTLHRFQDTVAWAGMILSGTTLYGQTGAGNSSDWGTVFSIQTDGTNFANLYNFTGGEDGARPTSLLLVNDVLYGTTLVGGLPLESGVGANNGVIFKLNTNGTGFKPLHVFNAGSFGATAALVASGSIFYGTSPQAGAFGRGTVFTMNTDGTGFTNLYNFGGRDGEFSFNGLVLSGNTLYGTTGGGTNRDGTVFALSLPSAPQLTVRPYSSGVVISWPTNSPNLVLQATTDLGPSGEWIPVSAKPVLINGANVVTNFFSSKQQFFRLSQ
jgi:uncharacterized repeat protein (TIGR03803 family)